MTRAAFTKALAKYGMTVNNATRSAFGTSFVKITENHSVPMSGSGTSNRRRTLAWLISLQEQERKRAEKLNKLRTRVVAAGTMLVGMNTTEHPTRRRTTTELDRDAEEALATSLRLDGYVVTRVLIIEEPPQKPRR